MLSTHKLKSWFLRSLQLFQRRLLKTVSWETMFLLGSQLIYLPMACHEPEGISNGSDKIITCQRWKKHGSPHERFSTGCENAGCGIIVSIWRWCGKNVFPTRWLYLAGWLYSKFRWPHLHHSVWVYPWLQNPVEISNTSFLWYISVYNLDVF